MSNAPKKPQGGMPMGGPHGPRGMGPRQPINKKVLLRVLSYLKPYWPRLLVVFFCIVLDAIATASAATFLGTLIDDYIVPLLADAASGIAPVYTGLLTAILKMAGLYLLAVVAVFLQSRIMAIISHSILKNVRNEMFAHMQLLPIRYFDTHTHGEVMSFYTNDTDTLRQLISQTLPNVFSSAISLLVVFISMLNCSVWLTLVVVLCTLAMLKVTGKLGAKSGTFFVKQQTSLASLNGYIEEMINGQKVVKVFNHEEIAKGEFDHRNDDLCENATSANRFANVMGPVSNNMGHIQYVILAIIGGAMAIVGITNLSLTGGFGTLTLGAITAFLTLSRNFMRPISQVMQQVNFIAMAMAGAERIFSLLDETPEADEGYVTLVNAREENGKLVESDKRTGIWAWKHPHQDGSVTYTRLTGNVEMTDVDFAYEEGKPVLHDITLYAKPGQKVAFVGATGAGKTTITNLLNRFYDIADGKIRYDGININKIRKSDLRRALGVVLQDVNLFTGTVLENIRYGKLDASDEECIAAAKLAGADDFITRLPEGYQTMLTGNGANLSQGQRQLIAIARAAVADPPVLILDEATSSIDTRTESLIEKGMDSLMKDRTVFVIAHRLSTVRNSDAIMVLEHGEIIERGNHDELIKQQGKYYQLYMGMFELS